MRNILTLSLLAFSILFVACRKDKVAAVETPEGFFENNWSATKEAAQTHDRKIFIHFYKPNCTKCAAFKRDILNDAEVEKYIKDNMVGVFLNTKESDGKSVSKDFDITGHPAMAIADKNCGLLVKRLGVIDKASFLDWLKTNQ